MRFIYITFLFTFLTSCVYKYNGAHDDYLKFNQDLEYCLKKICFTETESILNNLSFFSTAFAYGGGGGGGEFSKKNNFSYKKFNLCLEEKGYVKDENGRFELPTLTCN